MENNKDYNNERLKLENEKLRLENENLKLKIMKITQVDGFFHLIH